MTPSRRRSRLVHALLSIGSYEGEPETTRAGRQVFIVAVVVASLLTLLTVWSDFAAGFTWVAIANGLVVAATPIALAAIHRAPRRFGLIVTGVFCLVFVQQLVETTLFGGLMASGLAVVFGLVAVLGAMVALGLEAAMWWLGAFVASVVYAAVIPEWVDPVYVPLDPQADAAFNLIAIGLLTAAALAYFVRQRDRFQARSDDLLHNILPVEIAGRLKAHESPIADRIESVTVLFADLVDSTPLAERLTAHELVALLDSLFSHFDDLADRYGVEKITTIGDGYLAAAGVPIPRLDHAEAAADMALAMRDVLPRFSVEGYGSLRMRIGLHTGPVVAGVIGKRKFRYDLWGDTVNTASRMESHGRVGMIHVSAPLREALGDRYGFEPRGLIPVKGKGEMETYFLLGRHVAEPPEVHAATTA